MPEGPSLIILKEKIEGFKGKKIIAASGYAELDYSQISNRKITDIKTWGKHLFICLPKTNIEIHLRMFGSYTINKTKNINPKLSLQFSDSFLHFYVVDVKLTPDLSVYDWQADVMSKAWNPAAAKEKMKGKPGVKICDTLLDQHIFSGVGNIIKNEVLWRVKIHPAALIKDIPAAKMNALLKDVVKYSFEFLKYKKEGTLSKHWNAYEQKKCSRCGGSIKKEMMGKGKRGTYFCPHCQVLKRSGA